MATLSIVMPVYNAEQFLHRSIDSIINQTFTDWELILVDDGSVDNSPQICDEYAKKDKRIRVIHKENGGSGPARNAGIDLAQGKFVAFPDSDDWMDVEAYDVAVKQMQKTNADLLVFGIRTHIYNDNNDTVERVVEESLKAVYYKSAEECRCNYVNLHKCCNMNSPCNKIYRISVIRQHNIRFPELRRMQDGVFNMHCFDKIETLAVIENNLFNRTWHVEEVQRKKMPDKFLDIAIVYHRTAVDMLTRWGHLNIEAELLFDERFVENLKQIEYNCICDRSKSIFVKYKHIRDLNRNPYVRKVLKNYQHNKKDISKSEYAMLKNQNLILILYLYLR